MVRWKEPVSNVLGKFGAMAAQQLGMGDTKLSINVFFALNKKVYRKTKQQIQSSADHCIVTFTILKQMLVCCSLQSYFHTPNLCQVWDLKAFRGFCGRGRGEKEREKEKYFSTRNLDYKPLIFDSITAFQSSHGSLPEKAKTLGQIIQKNLTFCLLKNFTCPGLVEFHKADLKLVVNF